MTGSVVIPVFAYEKKQRRSLQIDFAFSVYHNLQQLLIAA
ncbi:hypothetical protein bmyco0003_4620 [Bacillus pseudomycoides]|nr:hypothetical protein bmyco0003_4620 [Bacillus pseudomycoides]OOG90298.1 hypothetical protein BTH41_03362 [Bacillus mycoides]